MPAAIVSNPTVLVNTSVPPPNFLPQATSIQSHIIQLGTSVSVLSLKNLTYICVYLNDMSPAANGHSQSLFFLAVPVSLVHASGIIFLHVIPFFGAYMLIGQLRCVL